MATERSDTLYQSYLEAVNKFDYFVLGISLALVGYLAESLSIGPLVWLDSSTVELASIVALLVSAVCGFKRIESGVQFLRLNTAYLRKGEEAGTLKSSAVKSGFRSAWGINESTGELLSPGEAMRRGKIAEMIAEGVKEKLNEETEAGGVWYKARNVFLFLGLGGVIVARIMEGYGL